jgi:protease-4
VRRGTKLFLAFLFLLILGIAAAASVSMWFVLRPQVRQGSVLHVDLSGALLEHDPIQELRSFLGEPSTLLADIVFGLEAAAEDDRVDSLLLTVGTPAGLDMAKAGELRRAIQEFRASGKPATAYIEFTTTGGYYVASACDNVYLMPGGMVWASGFLAEVPYLRGSLEKLKIEPEFVGLHEYKTANETYQRRRMSEQEREQLDAILDVFWAELTEGIAVSRGLDVEAVVEAIGDAPQTAPEAHEASLVDALLYWDQVEQRLGLSGEDDGAQEMTIHDYVRSMSPSPFATKKKVALVYGVGTILDGASDSTLFGGDILGSDTVSAALREAARDDSIDAIVFRVDSPGGSAMASEEIWREAVLAAEEKPVVVSMSYVAASGGYWIAMDGTKIVANPVTITGSIGVAGGKFNMEGLYDWIGVNWETVKRGEHADLLTDTRASSPAEREEIRALMEWTYDDFVRKVAAGRGMPEEKVREIARGRVWPGRKALELGLVDELGGISKAVELARLEAGISQADVVQLVVYPRPQGLWESLFGGSSVRALLSPPVEAPGSLGKMLSRARILERLGEEPVLALDPTLWLAL